MTATAAPAIPQLRFRLPGRWWQIPLTDLDEARASVRRLVDTAVGPRDDRATERDRLRRQLVSGVEAAVGGGGVSMQIALQIAEDLPIPVSFTVFTPTLHLSPAVGTSGDAVIGILQQGLERRADYNVETARRFSTQRSSVLRQHRTEVTVTEGKEGPEELPTLIVDYWLSVPGAKRVVLVSFSTALAGMDEIMLPFLDAIIEVTYWAGTDEATAEPVEPAESEPAAS